MNKLPGQDILRPIQGYCYLLNYTKISVSLNFPEMGNQYNVLTYIQSGRGWA